MGMIIVGAVVVVLIAVFSIQNASPVAITFLFWKSEVSLALAILVPALAGIVVGGVMISVAIGKMGKVGKNAPRESR
jgi:uncharacterized integral membrane protein